MPLGDDPLLVPLGGPAGHRLDRVPGRTLQFAVLQVGQPFGQPDEVGPGVEAEDEADSVGVPAVEVLRLGELGVSPERDPAEARTAAEGGGLVQVDVGLLVRGPVPLRLTRYSGSAVFASETISG